MTSLKALFDSEPEIRRNAMRRIAQIPAAWLFVGLVLFGSAGTLQWPSAWLFLGLLAAVDLIGLQFISLEVVAERGSKKANVEPWDVKVGKLIVLSMLGIFLTAGLDHRWSWSQAMAPEIQGASIVVFLLGCALEVWAMRVNRFFSDVVRLQFDKGHEVCSGGPYRFIRHPGYLGMIAYYLAVPILLGSSLAMIPAGMTVILFVVRTHLEDKTLLQKLPGYDEYANRVRFRLLPWIW
jgi:protein-S-isoprenylcysteine O-methyltransferase Ste14